MGFCNTLHTILFIMHTKFDFTLLHPTKHWIIFFNFFPTHSSPLGERVYQIDRNSVFVTFCGRLVHMNLHTDIQNLRKWITRVIHIGRKAKTKTKNWTNICHLCYIEIKIHVYKRQKKNWKKHRIKWMKWNSIGFFSRWNIFEMKWITKNAKWTIYGLFFHIWRVYTFTIRNSHSISGSFSGKMNFFLLPSLVSALWMWMWTA